MTSREPRPGEVRLRSDGISHDIAVWTTAGQWEPLRAVVAVSVRIEAPNEPAMAQLLIDGLHLDLLTIRERQRLQLAGLPPDASAF